MNKKGISPLIATILLISFAVALGAMILNWSADFESYAAECKEIELMLQTVNEVEAICFDEASGNLKFILENLGQVDVDSVLFRTVDFSYDIYETDIPDSKIEVGGVLSSELPYEDVESPDIKFIPRIDLSGKKRLCPNQMIQVEQVPRCDA